MAHEGMYLVITCQWISAVYFYFLVANPILDLAHPTENSVLKGYLDKYTNFVQGYNPRWFILKDGVLSCTSKAK